MIILGMDPGIATTGFAVLQKDGDRLTAIEYGVITTPAGQPPPLRLQTVYERVGALMDTHKPDALATERLFFAKNETTALGVGRTIGVILLAGALRGIDWNEYTPPEVKLAVVGYGKADKQQIQYMVTRLLNLPGPPKPDDAADACAVAICHANSAKWKKLTSG